jgi:RimJ/RimL family protein N-acetyltransferase
MLVAVDDRDHVALVAETVEGGRPIGIARYVRDRVDYGSADVAVSVVDVWQDRGIGTLLTRALAARARRADIDRFTIAMLPGNQAALRLARGVAGVLELVHRDTYGAEYTLALDDRPEPERLAPASTTIRTCRR